MEGSQSIETPIMAIYTRMINNPLYTLKLTERISKFDLYLLSSYDENSIYILPFEDFSFKFPTEKKSFINILRVKSDFINKESYIGFLLGDRVIKKDEFDNGFGRVLGFDSKFRFLRHFTIDHQGIYSKTEEPVDTNLFSGVGLKFKNYTDRFDGEKFEGLANEFKFKVSFRNLYSSIYCTDYSPTFRSDLGYITRNNFRRRGFSITLFSYPNKYGFTQINPFVNYYKDYNYGKLTKNESFQFGMDFGIAFAQINFGLNQSFYRKNFHNIYFKNLHTFNFWITSTPLKWLYVESGFYERRTIYYRELVPAYEIYFTNYWNIRLTKLVLGIGFQRDYLYRARYKNLIYDVTHISGKMCYSFTNTNTFSFRLITYYYTHTKDLVIYPMFTYRVNPFTALYFGANVNTVKYDEPFGVHGRDHQIFLKFQYSFKI